jgi:Fic family protein
MPLPPEEVRGMMIELVNWLNATTEINAILVSAIAQFQLVHIHPFLDGNGRTVRLLSTFCLHQRGYDFKRLFTISEYYMTESVETTITQFKMCERIIWI